MSKRVISLLLILVMLVGMLPVFAQAEEPTTSVDNGELTVEGTNGFGTLLAEDIAQEQEAMEEQQNAGYTLTDLEITGNTATVTYDSLEEATMVVALYTEDGMQLLTSGKTTVNPEETTATVTIEGEMPQYFMASAYLLDTYDMSPLCPAYDTPMYTQEMQELLASTAEDYDSDRVLQLSESTETNFAVYTETTKLIEQVEGVNTIVASDSEAHTYTIENADESFTSLQPGDIFSYTYGENAVLIAKVEQIVVDDTTVTITGGDLQMEEVFSHVKIEDESGTEDVIVDDSTAYEGIVYEGLVAEGSMARAITGGDTAKKSHKYSMSMELEKKDEYVDASINITASFTAQLSVGVYYYLGLTRQYVEFKASPLMKFAVDLDGRISGKLPLGTFTVEPCKGILVSFEPKLLLEFQGKLNMTTTLSATLGVRADTRDGVTNISTTPKLEPTMTVEGTLYMGVDFEPSVSVLDLDVKDVDFSLVELKLNAAVGVEIVAKSNGGLSGNLATDGSEDHRCGVCLDMDMTVKATLKGQVIFCSADWTKISIEIGEWTAPLGKAYYSVDHLQFGFGRCPYHTYRVAVSVTGTDKQPIDMAGIAIDSDSIVGYTRSNGVMITYLPAGSHSLTVYLDDQQDTKTVTIDGPTKINITVGQTAGVFNDITEEEFEDVGSLIASGICGDNLTWELYSSGILYIAGSGDMYDYDGDLYYVVDGVEAPWDDYSSRIRRVIIKEGVTSVGSWAFEREWKIAGLTLPEGITRIGEGAFLNCIGLSWIDFPKSLKRIDDYAFYDCSNLPDEVIPENVSLGYKAFYDSSEYEGPPDYDAWEGLSLRSADAENATGSVTATLSGDDVAVAHGANVGSLGGQLGGQMSSADAVFGGTYATETLDTYTLKTADFAGLVADNEYVLLAFVSMDAEDVLSADNLLFVDQAVAGEDGSLSFQYVQREDTALSYVMACGASNKNLNDALITFPDMIAVGETQVVQPVVVYDGKTLTEGTDYVITGAVDFTEAGEYTCYIRGIYNYAGLVTCTYQVREAVQPTLTLKYPTLTFEDVITMNVFFQAENLEDVVEMGLITYKSEVTEWNVDNAETVVPGYYVDESTGFYVVSTEGIAAKDMGDTYWFAVYAKLADGTYTYTKLVSYSPTTYAYNQLGDASMSKLVVAMLNYGAAAQTYFGYNTDNLMNAGLSADQQASIETYRADMMDAISTITAEKSANFTKTATGFTKRYPTITFEGAFSIDYLCQPSATPVGDITLYYWNQTDYDANDVLTAGNATGALTLEVAGDLYATAVEGIAAKDLDKGVYVAFCYSDGETDYCSGILGYSIGLYCTGLASGEDAMAPFAAATAVYGYYAKRTFN